MISTPHGNRTPIARYNQTERSVSSRSLRRGLDAKGAYSSQSEPTTPRGILLNVKAKADEDPTLERPSTPSGPRCKVPKGVSFDQQLPPETDTHRKPPRCKNRSFETTTNQEVLSRMSLVPKHLPFQKTDDAPTDCELALNFQFLNYLPRNEHVVCVGNTIAHALLEIDRIGKELKGEDLTDRDTWVRLFKFKDHILRLQSTTRGMAQALGPDAGLSDGMRLAINEKLEHLDLYLATVCECIADTEDALDGFTSPYSTGEVDSEDSDDSDHQCVLMDFSSFTRTLPPDTELGRLARHIDQQATEFQLQENTVQNAPAGSVAWCHAVVRLGQVLDKMIDLLTDLQKGLCSSANAEHGLLWMAAENKIEALAQTSNHWAEQRRAKRRAVEMAGLSVQ